jgi:hypothetical protein
MQVRILQNPGEHFDINVSCPEFRDPFKESSMDSSIVE